MALTFDEIRNAQTTPTANQQDVAALQNPQAATRSITMNPGDPMTFANTASPDPSQAFGSSLLQMLTKYQQLGTKSKAQLQQGQLNYSDAGINAANAQYTNPSLQGYAPSTIMNAGATAAKPFEAGAQGLAKVGDTFNEQLGNFGNLLNNANTYMQQQQALQEKAKADAQNIIHDAISTGSDAVAALIKAQPDLVKAAGYSTDTLNGVVTALKKTEHLASVKATSGSGGFSGSVPQGNSAPITSPPEDAAVAGIIRDNPGEWGHAADQIDAQFGKGTATQYDPWLKAVYANGQSIDQVYQPQDIGNLRSIDISRLSTAANRIVSQYVKSGAYTSVSNAVPYIGRIAAAMQNPGSVSDNDLLDSLIKINTGGNQVTEAQTAMITGGRSFADTANVWQKKLQNGGVLSDNQRQQIFNIAQEVFKNYQKAYEPVYKQATSQLQQARIPQSLWPIPDWNTLVGQINTGSSGSNNDPLGIR